mgnify:CR=1 FL=1
MQGLPLAEAGKPIQKIKAGHKKPEDIARRQFIKEFEITVIKQIEEGDFASTQHLTDTSESPNPMSGKTSISKVTSTI